ncbi:putative ABC transporter [Xylariales sp. AK1849]|nr:putative ABC transporter [Xylariales sp. AK1849]
MSAEPTHVLHTVSAICALTFLLLLPIKFWRLRNSGIRASSSRQGLFKAVIGVCLSVVLFSYWTRASVSDAQEDNDFLISLIASTLAALGLSVLLLLQQQRSHRASDLASLYLLASILCDGVQLAISDQTARHASIYRPILLRSCIHSALLLLEWGATRPIVNDLGSEQSPEEKHGLLSRALFLWINPILFRGYMTSLLDKDLPVLSQDMKPVYTRKLILQTWAERAKPETGKTLLRVLVTCLRGPFLAPVVPRLCLIFFRYSQPALIKESIRYVVSTSSNSGSSRGFWLVVSAVAVYVGLALTRAAYQLRLHKLQLMTRSALIALIYDKTLKSPGLSYDDGEATTLMSTDAESLDQSGEMLHETWAQVVEVIIGIMLLASQVGWIWPLPLFLIYLCTHMSRFVARNLQPLQKAWNVATQNRIAATSSMLSSMKVVKMLGLQDNLVRRVQQLREDELLAASKLRWVMVYYNASANALGIFSPAITLVIFALISGMTGRSLDTETAFTTTAILGMVTHPANMVMTIIPRAVAAFSGFERIQSFLLRPSLRDTRGILPRTTLDELSRGPSTGQLTASSPSIQIRNLKIGHQRLILEGVDVGIAASSFVIVSGPTSSGKSSLLRAILGEIDPAHGSINVSARQIAYCAQRPWLTGGTIQEVIFGATDMEATGHQDNGSWYQEVTQICCLTHDFDSLPNKDQTEIGSRGLNLSGGQRQRVALARALFARCEILLLDDTFSGLDGHTEQKIFDNLFGSSGLVRRLKMTVVLVSNSSQYFQAADHIVVLDNRSIIDQGNWQSLSRKAISVAKFSPGHQVKDNALLAANFDRLGAQVRAKDESEMDLARRSGDPALYGYYFGFVRYLNLFYLVGCTSIHSFFITFPQYWLQMWTESDGTSIAFYTTGYLFLSFMSWLSTSFQAWSVLIKLAPQSGSTIHRRLLSIVTGAPLLYFSQTENGSSLNRFSQDIQLVDKQLPSALQTVVVQIFKLLMQIILLCITQKWLTMSLPACMILIYVVQKIYLRTSRQLRFLELESRASVFSNFLESVEGVETIRSFGWSRAVIQDNTVCVDNAQRPEYLLLCLQRWLNIVLDLLAAAVATGVVASAVAFRDRVSGSQVGIALNIMLVANTTLLKLVESWTTLETSLGAIARLKTLETMTPMEGGDIRGKFEPSEEWPSNGNIEFKNITASYQYRSESVALQNISLSIPAGQKLVVCGRTGSGKSTLLLTLLRLLELRSGRIELDGVDIKQVSLDLLRRRCFVAVSQDPLLLSNETLRFNLDPDRSVADEAIVDALTKAGLWSHFCDAGNTRAGERLVTIPGFRSQGVLDQKISLFQELSVGQCQLFAVCRALVKGSSLRRVFGSKPVVILDEVTSSLDPATESSIYRIINDEFTEKGHTVIIVAHRLSVLKEYTKVGRDAVVLMADGRLQRVIKDLDSAAVQQLAQTDLETVDKT